MNKEQALQILRDNRAILTETYGVRRIGLFGSIVRDQLKPEIEIDIVVVEAAVYPGRVVAAAQA